MEQMSKAPYDDLMRSEINQEIVKFITVCSLIKGSPQNLQQIFTILYKEPEFMELFKEILCLDQDIDAYRTLLAFDTDSTISKSKSISRMVKNGNK